MQENILKNIYEIENVGKDGGVFLFGEVKWVLFI